VEAADECWHEFDNGCCKKCGALVDPITFHGANPSPADLNELFRLAEKLELGIMTNSQENYHAVNVWDGSVSTEGFDSVNLYDALRKALVKS
jgi:hypothetical protein